MINETIQETWEAIAEHIRSNNAAGLRHCLAEMSPSDVARAVTRLSDEEQAGMLMLLGPEHAADLLEELPDHSGVDLIEELHPSEAAAIVDEMASDHRVDLLGELDQDNAEAILDAMDPEEADDARLLLTYPEDTAGGIMATEYLAFQRDMLISEVFDTLRRNSEEYSDYGIQYIYVVLKSGRLVGVVPLRELLMAPADAPLQQVMIGNPLYAQVNTPVSELNMIFDRYPFMGLPVIDHEGHLVGVVRRGDAEEAYSEQAEQTFMRFGGIIGGEEVRSMPARQRAMRRLAWLVVNLCLSMLAASVILHFNHTLESMLALVFFIPIVANMSGCSGNQAVAVSIRELSLGLIKPEDFLRVFRKEMQVGLITGSAMAIMLGFAAYVLHGNLVLSLVVGASLGLNILVALTLGGLIPLLLKRFGADPALAAPLMLTTMSDMCGFLFVLGFSTLLLGYLL